MTDKLSSRKQRVRASLGKSFFDTYFFKSSRLQAFPPNIIFPFLSQYWKTVDGRSVFSDEAPHQHLFSKRIINVNVNKYKCKYFM